MVESYVGDVVEIYLYVFVKWKKSSIESKRGNVGLLNLIFF